MSESSLACSNQSAKPGSWRCWAWNSRTIIMRSQSVIGTRIERPPPSRNLRKAWAVWFFLFGGKSLARSMKQFLPIIAGSSRSSWRLKPPPCVGRLQRKMRASDVNPVSCREARSMVGRSSATVGRLRVRSIAFPHSSRASPRAPVRTSSRPWSSDGISASDWAVKRSHSSRKSIASASLASSGAAALPKPSAAARVEMKPPFSSGTRSAGRPIARACGSAPAPGCGAWRGR